MVSGVQRATLMGPTKSVVGPVRLWEPTFDLLGNRAVVDLSVVGRLPEVVVALAEHRYVSSFMTAEGDPSWALFDRRGDTLRTLSVRGGSLNVDIKLRTE
jgi:hypothetical protein